FRSLIVVRRLLDVPLAAERVLNRQTRIGSLLLGLNERVDVTRIRRECLAPLPIQQVALLDVPRELPEFRQRRVPRHHRRLHLCGAERVVERDQQRTRVERWHPPHGRLLSGYEWDDRRPAERGRRSLERIAELEEDPPSLGAVADVDARERQ